MCLACGTRWHIWFRHKSEVRGFSSRFTIT